MPDVLKKPSLLSDIIFVDSSNGRRYIDCSTEPRSRKPRTVLSLFSGAGGFDLGLELAGFETIGCVELDRDCRETLKFNRPKWRLMDGGNLDAPGDVRELDPEGVLATLGKKRGDIDLIVGGPPCQPFSNLGKKKGQGDSRNGDLTTEFARMIDGLLPKGFIFENVGGFTHHKHEEARKYLTDEFDRLGYTLASQIICSADYGDPQIRKRFVILGIREALQVALPLPKYFETTAKASQFYERIGKELRDSPKIWQTVGETLAQIPESRLLRPDCIHMGVSDIVARRMALVKPGDNFKVLPPELLPDCWKSGKHQGQDTFGRLRADRPSVTIRTSAYNVSKGRFIHPFEDRGLNTAEMAALQSFPYEYEFKCVRKPTLVGIGKMIGNAVPIRLAKALGQAMALQLT